MDSKTKDILNRPFERALIKERVGPGGKTLSYVAIGDYIARLNEAFDGDWTYEITETKLLDEEAIVQVRLTAAGMIKMGMGGASITRRRDSGKPVSIAHDVMAAEASGLKRACRLLGIGAALYLDDEEPVAADQQEKRNTGERPAQYEGETPSSSPRITNAQIAKLRSMVKDWYAFRNSVREQHGVNVEYADRRLASRLIQEMLDAGSQARSNGQSNGIGNGQSNGHGNGNGQSNGNSNGNGNGWQRP